MKNRNKASDRIISTGRQSFKMTDEYRRQVELIRNEITLRYLDLENNERNSFKKLILLIKKRIEIRKAMNKLTSQDKMYIIKLLFTAALFVLTVSCFGQQSSTWDKWNGLTGEWKGEGSGQPGQGGGTFSFRFDLDNKIIVRKSHSEYPATENKPKIVHDDLMIVYVDSTGCASKAIYFDNEGHIINYSITYSEKSIVFTSDKMPKVPVFRLTYTLLDNDVINVKFEMSQDGERFMTYIEGKSKRAK